MKYQSALAILHQGNPPSYPGILRLRIYGLLSLFFGRTSTITLKDFVQSKTSQEEVERIFGKRQVDSIMKLAE